MAKEEAAPLQKPMTLEEWREKRPPLMDVNRVHEDSIKGLERVAVFVTDKVGTMGFFLLILAWTILWCGYNILASDLTFLHWHAFDPFPAFVAYLLMSNVIQLLLMPLIMVGQNLQGRHFELRAEHDLTVNVKAEQEIEVILMHLEHQQVILMQLVEAQGLKIDTVLQDTATDLTVLQDTATDLYQATTSISSERLSLP